ncbi:MAG: hypothetical protein ACYS1A_08485 [Planctomycetota bacterium]
MKQNHTQQPSQIGRSFPVLTLLILAGLAMLIYGTASNSVTVVAQKETQTEDTFIQIIPSDKPPSVQTENLQISESDVIRDVTVGGLVRLSTGMIKRTYTGEPDLLCPT